MSGDYLANRMINLRIKEARKSADLKTFMDGDDLHRFMKELKEEEE